MSFLYSLKSLDTFQIEILLHGRTRLPGSLVGRVALITGASSAIGRAAALAFAREGASVMIGSRRTQEGEATVAAVKRAGGDALFLKTDVSDRVQVEALVRRAVEAGRKIETTKGVEG